MALKRINYTGIDFESIVETVTERMKAHYGSQWNDEFADGLGTMLIEAFAEVCDMNLFYLDQRANECFLVTAKERSSVIAHCKGIGYTVQNAKSAQVDLKFTPKEKLAAAVKIPAGTQCESAGGVIFETTEEGTLAAGDENVVIPASQGETVTERAGYSNGEPRQSMELSRGGVTSIKRVEIDGENWTPVDGFAESGNADTVYTAEQDGRGMTRIAFGDGINGQIPRTNARVNVTYSIGIGAAGNVAANTITRISDALTDENGEAVQLDVTNEEAASGGADPETIEHAKLYAPRFFETQGRCVTEIDYETAAIAFDGENQGRIAKARAIVTQQTGDANIVTVYVLAYGPEKWELRTASEGLKNGLKAYLQERAMLTALVEVKDGSTQTVNITASIGIAAGIEWATVKESAVKALHDFFALDNREFGQPLRFSDLNAVLDNISGVDYVEFTEPSATVTAEPNTLLTLGTVTLTEARE